MESPSSAHELALPELREVERQLRRLERNSSWMWVAAATLLIVVGATILSVLVAPEADGTRSGGGARYEMVVGLCGLVALFSLYMLYKQHELQRVRTQLFDAVLRAESLRSRLTGLSSLFEGLAHVGGHIELEPALQTLAEHVRASLGGEQCSIMLLDPETRELHCVAVAGDDGEFVREARVRLGEGVAGWVAQNDEPVVLTPEVVEQRFPFAKKPLRGIISGLCVPLSLPDRVIGVLSVNRLGHGPTFNTEDARLVSVFASHIAIATRRMQERETTMRSLRGHEEQLRQSQKMEALGRLAGGVAHDFNNLLTVILAYSGKVARHLPVGEKMRDYADRVCDAAERCVGLTRQLTMFSRKQAADARVLDLNQAVSAMGDLLRRVIGEDVTLDQRLALDLRPVRMDPTQVEQVIVNLVVNARDAISGNGRVTIETSNAKFDAAGVAPHVGARPGSYVVITISDTGRGMDAETRDRVFEPFFSTKSEGTGLGLATVYGIVQQNGGFITLDSELGRGATFRVHLPAAERRAIDAIIQRDVVPELGGGATIVVVEDEEDVRQLVSEFLLAQGHTVLTSSWAGEAAVLVENTQEIDLVITDVVLPGESGIDLARWIQRIRPGVPVLFMSGYPDADLVKRGVTPGTNEFLQKPFTKAELLERVSEILGARPSSGEPAVTQAA